MRILSYSKVSILLLVIILLWANFSLAEWKKKEAVITWDVKSYYAYLPAIFIYKDITLSFRDQKPEYAEWFWPTIAPNGNMVIVTTMGLSILYSPFFFIAHFLTQLINPGDANGFTSNYIFMLVMSTVFYVILGLLFLRKMLLRYFNEGITALILITISLGTNLFCYSTIESAMSHAYSFSLVAIFLYYTELWGQSSSAKNSILLGLTSGLITLIRPTNIIIGLLFLLWKTNSLKEIAERLKLIMKHLVKILLIILFAFIVWIPQLIYWRHITGNWFHFSYGSSAGFFFGNPQVLDVLFSFRNGLFVYTPIMLVALFGMFLIIRTSTNALAIISYFVLNVYVISSWWCWWYGGAFGGRSFIDSYAIYAIPLGVVYQRTSFLKIAKRIILYFVFGAFIVINVFFTYKYLYGSIHFDSMTPEALFDSFWRLRPRTSFYEKLAIPDYEKAEKGIYETIHEK
jgi:hypothetical protein